MSYAEFWGAVVEQAVLDLLKPDIFCPTEADKANALAWINDASRAPCGYVWACEMSGIDPDIGRQALRKAGILTNKETA